MSWEARRCGNGRNGRTNGRPWRTTSIRLLIVGKTNSAPPANAAVKQMFSLCKKGSKPIKRPSILNHPPIFTHNHFPFQSIHFIRTTNFRPFISHSLIIEEMKYWNGIQPHIVCVCVCCHHHINLDDCWVHSSIRLNFVVFVGSIRTQRRRPQKCRKTVG